MIRGEIHDATPHTVLNCWVGATVLYGPTFKASLDHVLEADDEAEAVTMLREELARRGHPGAPIFDTTEVPYGSGRERLITPKESP